jgi:hypothetical protein
MFSVNIPSHLNVIRIGGRKLRAMSEPKLITMESSVKDFFQG